MTQPSTIPAATIVIFRRSAAGGPPELLMVQRSKQMRFAGGAAVFPGGKIDAADRELALRLAPDGDPDDTAARIAAIRETLEETGLVIGIDRVINAAEATAARAMLLETMALAPVLDHFGWRLQPDALTAFSHWCPNWEGAFDTRFYLANLGTGAVDLAVDATENSRLFWTSAIDALDMAEREDISIIFPTRRNLERLAQFANYAEAKAQAAAIPMQVIQPKRIERDGETFLTIPSGLGYPVTEQNMATVKRG